MSSRRLLRAENDPVSRGGTWAPFIAIQDVSGREKPVVIDGDADVAAIAAGPSQYPWVAFARGLETVIESAETRTVIACFPGSVEAIRTHISGRRWLGIRNGTVFAWELAS
jgi:hypothetical protein